MRNLPLLAATAIVAFVAAGGGALASNRIDGAVWGLGGNDAQVFQAAGEKNLQTVSGTFDAEAQRIVSQSAGGNFEFEHNPGAAASDLQALDPAGHSTPLQLGTADGQDVTAVVVTGNAVTGTGPKTTAVQSWRRGGRAVSEIDRLGRLRLGGIVLEPVVGAQGRVALEAILPDGSKQRLVPAAP